VASKSGGNQRPSSKIESWELEQIARVAKRFPDADTEELKAELAVALLELKGKPPIGVRSWKAYLYQSLFHKALTVVKIWRARRKMEAATDFDSETGSSFPVEPDDIERLQSRLELAAVRDILDPESYALLEVLAHANGNQSQVARLLGKHRNTIRRQLNAIRARLSARPIENVSTDPRPSPKRVRLELNPVQREELTRSAEAKHGSRRAAFKARLILALASGQAYKQIEAELKTTAPTISRWKRRFERNGLEGLKPKHPGRMPRADIRTRLKGWIRRNEAQPKLPCRRIARALGVSKSTAHRLLREHRVCRR
jgi:transposase/DNA-directed RNA polymerase specialized sigma24 family protein